MPPKAKGTYRLSETAAEIVQRYGNKSVTATLVHLDTQLQKEQAVALAKEKEADRLQEIITDFRVRAKEGP